VSATPTRGEIEARVLAWMEEPDPRDDEARFDALARDLFQFQFAHCAAYRRFCEGRGVTPRALEGWRDIPAVPTGAFKELVLTSFPEAETRHVFRTSGTSTSTRGALYLDTLTLYEGSLLPAFQRAVLPDLAPGERAHAWVLAPAREEVPDSSLSHMFGVVLEELCDSTSAFFVKGGTLEVVPLLRALEGAETDGPPLVLCGTAFGFVHLLEALESLGRRLALPARTRIMETGGFKGRARERSRDELYAEIETALGVPPARIVNQYGMTELGSQFYDSVLVDPDGPRRKLAPPWTRVWLEDPATGVEAARGEPGVIRIVDLANTGSVCAIQTADLGRAVDDGFDVLGREPDAEARGCSIAADELLGGS
jgi:hypothetical protein